jgi:uncharacterized DUF497 family protein
MDYEWDDAKGAANLTKHGVPFERAAKFEWDKAVIDEDLRHAYGERRFNAFAPIEGRLHAMVFTRRGSLVRIIGLRKANAREVGRYEKEET